MHSYNFSLEKSVKFDFCAKYFFDLWESGFLQ